MTVTLAYLNGDLRCARQVRLPAVDGGLLQGDGLFETLRVEGGDPVDLPAHLDRLFEGLSMIGIALPESRADLARAIHDVARSSDDATARLRASVVRGADTGRPMCLITVAGYRSLTTAERQAGVAAVTWRFALVTSGDPFRRLKSMSYQKEAMASRAAAAAGAWEALLLNERDRLVEGSRSNVIVDRGGRLVTPPVDDGCLPGTVRRRLLEAGAMEEDHVGAAEIGTGPGLLLSNSLVGMVRVASVDGKALPEVGALEELRSELARAQRQASE